MKKDTQQLKEDSLDELIRKTTELARLSDDTLLTITKVIRKQALEEVRQEIKESEEIMINAGVPINAPVFEYIKDLYEMLESKIKELGK